MNRFIFLIALFVFPVLTHAQYTVSGHIYDASDGESLPGASVYLPASQNGTATNAYGFYSLTIPVPLVRMKISYLGYQTIDTTITMVENITLNFYLKENVGQFEEIEVVGQSDLTEEVNSTRMGTIKMTPQEIRNIPTLGGEADLIKVAQLLPGVTKGGEGTTGMFVRGGTDDQNLVVLDEAVVYNLSHLFGFFSVFNADAIKNVELVKGGFPADYGGRLSSVMDVRMNEGSLNRFNARGGVGLLTSRLTLDGPIIKDRMSFMVAARRTYIDKVFGAAGIPLPYYFYDYNMKLNYKISEQDRIFVSSYLGDDVLAFNEVADEEQGNEDLNFGFRLGNFTSTVRWNHIYNNQKLFSNITLHQTRFKYDINGEFIDNSIFIGSQIQDVGAKADWQYFYAPHNKYFFGSQITGHFFRPNIISTSGDIADIVEDSRPSLIQNIEGAVYAGNERDLNSAIKLNAGLRYSYTSVDGAFYHGPEPRLALRYKLTEEKSIKASYSLMRQYMHRVSSSSLALPTDLWYPVTASVAPQRSHQVSVGYSHIFPQQQLSFSLETYYKTLHHLIEYREGASLILNDNFEDELIAGEGSSYGLELLLRKKTGKVSGWVSYSLSKTDRTFAGLNQGITYPARYDRRHVINLVSMMELNDRVTFSAVWAYQSGSWFTPVTGQFIMPNASLTNIELVPIYGSRNGTPLASSHRLDINFILKPRGDRRFGGEWHFGAYNFYNRAAPFRVAIINNGVTFEYVQEGLFGFIPFIHYNFNFSSK